MSLYEKVVKVISRPPDQRSDFEIQALLAWFRKRTPIFADLKTDFLKDIMRNCKFGTKQRDDMIIKQGDIGDCFYVVLSGAVSIYIHNQDKGDEEEKQELESIVQYKDGKLDRAKLGNYVTLLGAGTSFGEVALIDETCVRTASIVADDTTDLVIVDKALYTRSVKDSMAREYEEKRQFISNNSLFSFWAPKYRKQLIMALYKAVYSYESTLVRQGDEVECVYFIIRGQVEIQIDPSMHPLQYPKIFLAANQNEAEKLIRKSDKTRPPTEIQFSNNIKKRDNSIRSRRLCYLGINETVGDTEVTMELDTYLQSAVCKEQTEVLVLEKKHYERLFLKRHPRTIDAMRKQLGVKLLTRQSLLSTKDDIPFLGYITQLIEIKLKPPQAPEREKVEPTVSEAEKEFLNHKGPLIDQYGPGSVFYLIKVREQTKLKLRSKRERIVERPQALKSLPASVIMAAQQLMNGSHDESHDPDTRPYSARGRERINLQPRSFRRIQSANQTTAADMTGDSTDLSEGWDSGTYSNGVSGENAEEHDARLSFLEERIRNWLRKDNPRAGPQVAQLRRLTAQDMETQPRPGNKVVIRRRRRLHSADLIDGNPRPKKEDGKTAPYKILLTNS